MGLTEKQGAQVGDGGEDVDAVVLEEGRRHRGGGGVRFT